MTPTGTLTTAANVLARPGNSLSLESPDSYALVTVRDCSQKCSVSASVVGTDGAHAAMGTRASSPWTKTRRRRGTSAMGNDSFGRDSMQF